LPQCSPEQLHNKEDSDSKEDIGFKEALHIKEKAKEELQVEQGQDFQMQHYVKKEPQVDEESHVKQEF
jgi:hypothetical protein